MERPAHLRVVRVYDPAERGKQMGHGKKPGPDGLHNERRHIRDGTLSRQESPRPGAIGIRSPRRQGVISNQHGTAAGWSSEVEGWFDRAGESASGHAKSVLLSLLNLLPFKPDSPFSTALLKHYVEGSGDPYDLGDIPAGWQDWIVKATGGRPGMHRDLNPYNSGLYDLRNSLGHFDVEVKAGEGGKKMYNISDIYEFGYRKDDRAQRGRHGFPLGDLSDWKIAALRRLLPTDEYTNPGGFKEHWEIKRVGKEVILLIPQQYLAKQGKPFAVTGSFTR